VSLALIHPISTNMAIPELRTNVGIGIILDRVGYIDGLQVGLVNSVTHDLRGLQVGAASLAEGGTDGAQMGGVFAFTDGPLQGVQIAGLLSWSGSSLSGLQIAGAANQASQQVHGAQLSLGANLTYGDVEGVQIGAVNVGKVRGFQLGLVSVNYTRGDVEGVQIGAVNVGKIRGLQLGLVNVSADTRGTQIGIINVARRSDGLQIGVINVTDNLRGESLGIASIPRLGGVHLVVWGSNSLSYNLGVEFASKFTYSVVSAAVHRDGKDTIFGGGLTLGIRVPLLPSLVDGFKIGSDIGGYRLFRDTSPTESHGEMFKTRFLVMYDIARHFSMFAGFGAHVAIGSDAATKSSVGPEIFAGFDL
jgi:hypothetical protein